MNQLLNIFKEIKRRGNRRQTRSGVVYSMFDHKIRFDLRKGYPAPTTKKLMFKAMAGEGLWFMRGFTDLPNLRLLSNLAPDAWTIWTNDFERWGGKGNEEGGRLYGYQWRRRKHDALQDLIDKMIEDPTSRYIKVVTWNDDDVKDGLMALPPCHTDFRVYVEGSEFDLKWTQRSVDTFLGLPFNIASYAFIANVLGEITGLTPRFLIGDLDDVHIYEKHLAAVEEQLSRTPYESPRLIMPEINSLEDLSKYTAADFSLEDYYYDPAIKAELSVG